MKVGLAVFLTIGALLALSGFAGADRLPNQTPENQIFTIDTVVDATGVVDSGADMNWVLTNGGAIPTGTIASTVYEAAAGGTYYTYPGGKVVADVRYKDAILTNGGKLAENKNFNLDSRDKGTGLYNIGSDKVLTYGTTEGAHMVGEEEYTLNVAAEAKKASQNIRCVFATAPSWLPPFCNIVSAKSALVNMNSAQVSTKGTIRSVASTDDVPAGLNYQIAVTPDANSGSGFAEGTVTTTFAGSVMEGRGSGMYWTQLGVDMFNSFFGTAYKAGEEVPWDIIKTYPSANWWNELGADDTFREATFGVSATNSWKDSSEVTGGIKAFQKAFAYNSGLKF